MTRLEPFRLKSMWGNYNFDYACSLSRGRSGGVWKDVDGPFFMVNVYAPQDHDSKVALWSNLVAFIANHAGTFLVFGDFNSVRVESERSGSSFSSDDADFFNSFLEEANLFDLPQGGRAFTYMNTPGTKFSKLDRFLLSQESVNRISDINVTVLDRKCSDHNPVLLSIKKVDYGPIPFKFFKSWLSKNGIDDKIASTWIAHASDPLHVTLKTLKNVLKPWIKQVMMSEQSELKIISSKITDIDLRLDRGIATPSERQRQERLDLLKERDEISILHDMDVYQKARIKWDLEGDENSKFFHSLINQQRRTQAINGVLQDGT
ncbi:uncharacterized protein [Rutidosis leptorrhynchoides]|uniref:uncharacterized protein n=1 Tax=Rutidosis leptorrhynchoides TaxID=125765 RepID=UPI003A99D0F9